MRRIALVPLLVFALVLAALLVRGGPRLAVPPATARAAATHDAAVRDALFGERPDRVRVLAFDRESVRVSLYRGPRLLANALVDRGGRVTVAEPERPGFVVLGDGRVHAPLGLLALGLLLVVVLLPARPLDLALLLLPAVPVLLYDQRMTTAGNVAALLVLLALIARLLVRAGRDEPPPAGRSLPGVSPRALAIGAGLAALVVTVTSQGVSDVGEAALRGGTLLGHGVLPYGHLDGGIVHGDTYPPLLYLLYVPVTALMPFRDAFFDNADPALWMAAAASVAVAALLARAGGWRPAAAWFAFSPALLATSAGSTDVWVAVAVAALVGGLARGGGTLVGVGAWTKIAPVVLLPLWGARLDAQGRLRLAAGVGAATVAALGVVVAVGGAAGVGAMARAMSFQASRQSVLAVWDPGLWAVQPVAEAAFAAVLVALSIRVARDRALATDPGRMAALAGVALLGLQLCGSYWSPTYLAWAFPAIALALLAPSSVRGACPPPAATSS